MTTTPAGHPPGTATPQQVAEALALARRILNRCPTCHQPLNPKGRCDTHPPQPEQPELPT